MNVPPHQARPFTFYYFNHSWDSRIIHPIHRLNSRRFIPDHASPCRTLPPCPSPLLQVEVVVLFYTVPYMNGGRVLDILQSTGWSENLKNLDFIDQDLIPFLFTTLCWQKRSNFYSDMLHLICVLNSSLVTVALSGCVWITLKSSTITSKLSLKRACSYLMFCEAHPHSCWTQIICIFALLQLIFLRDLFCISPATFSTIYLTTKWK